MMSKIAPSEPVGVTALRSVADIIHVMLSHHACPSQLLLEFRPPPVEPADYEPEGGAK